LVDKRIPYEAGTLDEASARRDPFAQFAQWLQDAADAGIREPAAMTLATASIQGRPSARIVLLRGHDRRGFVFFTNYQSRKGRELEENRRAALVFYWDDVERQLRIEGDVARLEPGESDAYFAQRPRGHQLSAWASQQSAVISDRASLESATHHYDALFAGRPVQRPPYWGGFRVQPLSFEFWQGRADRVHDRILYTRDEDDWRIARLAP
jgi:pyridoxamine 5'-phosphate oxidase